MNILLLVFAAVENDRCRDVGTADEDCVEVGISEALIPNMNYQVATLTRNLQQCVKESHRLGSEA